MQHLSPIYRILFIAGMAGLALSLLIHVRAVMGASIPLLFMVPMHVGIFPVFAAGIIGIKKYLPQGKRIGFSDLKIPGIAKVALVLLFVYTPLNFMLSAASGDLPNRRATGIQTLTPEQEQRAEMTTQRMFSGHWMLFYAAGMAMIYMTGQYKKEEEERLQNGEKQLQ